MSFHMIVVSFKTLDNGPGKIVLLAAKMHFRRVNILYTILIHVLPHIVMNKYSKVYFSQHYSVQPIFNFDPDQICLKMFPQIVCFHFMLCKMAAILNFETFKM